tara:strand:+ start:6831 stop:7385 length:555 start_codon:yes stop_codon:yes gene_type:complete
MTATPAGKQNAWQKQLSNRNFLSPVGFKFNLKKAPKVDFFSTAANIPSINLGVAIQSTYLKDLPTPGDKMAYDDFSLRFAVDENLENYLEIHDWMRGLGFPESIKESMDLISKDPINPGNPFSIYSDGTLLIYNSSYNVIAKATFKDMFPTSLTQIEFDAQDTSIEYVMAEVSFKYTIYEITKV